ncbi:hypothetical protein B484DRAFT_106691 [Ochromonadaceae sp. CCMP2298]|nr:hypothetical protein B484DRAFT_106691 [Ochromonadaceae sp. CCMP2298]
MPTRPGSPLGRPPGPRAVRRRSGQSLRPPGWVLRPRASAVRWHALHRKPHPPTHPPFPRMRFPGLGEVWWPCPWRAGREIGKWHPGSQPSGQLPLRHESLQPLVGPRWRMSTLRRYRPNSTPARQISKCRSPTPSTSPLRAWTATSKALSPPARSQR